MSENTLPAPAGAVLPAELPNPLARLSGPFAQVKNVMGQPAVKKALPMIGLVLMVALAAIAWSVLRTPPQRTLYQGLGDADKAAISEALTGAGIKSSFDNNGTLTVNEDDFYKARMTLAAQGLPKSEPGGYQILDQLPLGVSRAVEGERLRQARETELARSIQEIEAVAEARVHLATPEQSVFLRDNAQPSASVVLRLNAGRSLSQDQVRSIVNLVASSVPGMKPDAVTVVDQAGELLTKDGAAGGDSAGDKRIEFQRKLEDKYRQQLITLLTPLVGAGNFTAEVQADVDLDETQATRESYDKEGAALRAEQGQWTATDANNGENAGGIPGALSNTPPAAATVQPGAPGQPPANAAEAAAQPNPTKQNDSFTRSFELGKEVSVTKATPGSVKRLSVAVVLREAAGAKKRTPAEVEQITQLIRAATGFTQQRGDVVSVISRPFDGAAADEASAKWYEASWLPMVVRNATALVIALLVLFIGVKPLVGMMTKKQAAAAKAAAEPVDAEGRALPTPDGAAAEGNDEQAAADAAFAARKAAARSAGSSLEMLDSARSYDDKVALVREFTREDPTRAALAVKEMIRS
ncbi:flagellar basal-body MS-ring/collar protein FliF [Sphingomonas sp. ID0503]|uniref:flagellar basal-body MS-ring/collar protein FliF n=1 Tax=Sphingomonas sp. ID0503 TaxID=3399691 RepID=UPI003AFA2435